MAASSREHVFISSGALAAVKECKIITVKYTGKPCRLLAYLLYSSAPEDIILWAIRPGSTKFEGKNFYLNTKLIRSKAHHREYSV